MALHAFRSLKHQLECYVDNRYSRDSVTPSAREILEFAYDQVHSSEEIARKLVLTTTSCLDFQIRVAVQKLLRKMYSLRDMETTHSDGHTDFPRDELEALERDVISFAGVLKEIEAELPVAGEDDEAIAAVSSSTDVPKMVGLSDQYEQLKDLVKGAEGQIEPFVVVLVGMPGIGKTTLATKVFQDPDTVTYCGCRVWVTVGRKCQLKEIPRRILAAVNPDAGSDQNLDDEEIARCLRECLNGKRYLIVLDDVWNQYMACQFRFHSKSSSFEPDTLHRDGLVMITTRIHQVELDPFHRDGLVLKMPLLNNEESWDLLREKVFGEEQSCPPHLEEDGKKIAENCEGLPLTIVTVADLLSKEEKTPKYWRDVAAKKNHKLFKDAYDKISKVLYSSYQELTHVLKLCSLYMGVFPQDFEIPRSKLINMWNVDGFIETGECKFQYPSAIECLDELVSNSVVMIYQSTIGDASDIGRHKIKTCGLHSSLWYLSRREATEAKFCHVLNVLDDCSDNYLEGQSRLSFHNNILFGIKVLCQSVEDKCASTAHSLLCYGLYQPYQVPVCFGLNKLQELDALTIRFYEFPMDVLQLVELKYLALTLNGKLPNSVSQLSKLQFLIVDRHMSIKSYRELSTYLLPMEIWDMKELKHLQVMGSDLLPDPRGSLESLSTLSDVSAHSCTEGVLKAISNLRKLGIRIESVPNDGGESLVCFDHIYHLEKLASLKCVVVNPETVPRFALSPSFPKNLRKLSLSGLGCSWGEISKIASLEYLEVLKLQNYACRGPKWEVENYRFISLKSLAIEDTDLEEWTIGRESLQLLQSLTVKHCYKLQRIRWVSYKRDTRGHRACHSSLEKIELVDCNPSGVQQMKKALPPWKEDALAVHSSWKDEKLKA